MEFNMIVKEATSQMTKNPPGALSAIEEVVSRLPITLPADYLDFMRQSNGVEGPIGQSNYLVVWPIERVLQANENYCVGSA